MSDNIQEKAPSVKKFSYFEPIVGIIIAIVCTVVFLWFSPIITIAFDAVLRETIPTFNENIIHSLWIPIILWGLVRIGGNVAYLIERIYTKRLAIISLAGNGLTAVLTLIIFISNRIVNVDYAQYMRDLFANTAAWFGSILANPHIVIIVIIFFVLILDSITVVRKRKKRMAIEEKEEAAEGATTQA